MLPFPMVASKLSPTMLMEMAMLLMSSTLESLSMLLPQLQPMPQPQLMLQLQRVHRDPPWGVGVVEGPGELERFPDAPEVADVLQGPALGVPDQAGRRRLLLESAARARRSLKDSAVVSGAPKAGLPSAPFCSNSHIVANAIVLGRSSGFSFVLL